MNICHIEKASENTTMAMLIPHMHLWYEMYVLVRGERTLYIENDRHDMADNSLICIPPQHLHSTEGAGYTRYNINFSESCLDEFQANVISICQQQKIQMSPEEANHIYRILDTLNNIQNNNSASFKDAKDYAFHSCFCYLIVALTQLNNFPSQKYVSPNNYNYRTRQIISYLNEHYAEKITLDSLADIFYVSKRTLCADFKKYTDMTIVDYLLKIRLTEAQRLLALANKRKIQDIAERCGFSSQNYFCLIFKKTLHMSPSDYREQTINRFSRRSKG